MTESEPEKKQSIRPGQGPPITTDWHAKREPYRARMNKQQLPTTPGPPSTEPTPTEHIRSKRREKVE